MMLPYALCGILLVVSVGLVLLVCQKLRHEKALRRKENKRLISILDAVQAPITVTNENMEWTFVNKAVEQFLGVKREEIIGKKCSRWNANICNTPNCGITRLRNGHSETYFEQYGGSYHVMVAYLYDENGRVDGHVEVVRDITEIKKLAKNQAEAEAANRAKSAFLAKVSHEIRTPMNAILGITEIQLQNEVSPDTREALEKIHNSGYLLLSIINDILDLSKIEAGKMELAPVEYDVTSLINDSVHLMRFDSKPVKFKLQVDENIPAVLFGDELRIKQILNNLLSNAFKYTDRGEISFSITVDAEKPQGALPQALSQPVVALVFRISDTGQGMTKEQVDKLFDEYTRFNMAANRATEGTGLGMSITRHLVRMMNGEISVESEPGKGSVFTVRLPQGNVGGEVLGRALAENLQKLNFVGALQRVKQQITREYMPYGKVLIVDDVETNLYVVKGLLAPYGLSVDTAASGPESIERIRGGNTYDIVFMDHFMPKMDGIEAAKIIRDMGYTRPIVALTANALSGQAEMFLANGFDNFISKPIDIRQLNTVLNHLVRDRHLSEASETIAPLETELPMKIDSQLAEIFVRDAEKAIAALETVYAKQGAYEDEDIQAYITNIHGVKSALANIGEAELSACALALEKSVRQGDVSVISRDTPAFLEKLRAVWEKMSLHFF